MNLKQGITPEPTRWPDAGFVLVDDLAGLADLQDEWLRLEAVQDDSRALFFQSHAWVSHVARVRLSDEPGFRIMVVAGFSDGRLCFIWPLALVRRGGVLLAVMLDHGFGQFADVLVAPGVDASGFVRLAVEALKGRADGVRILQVPEASPLRAGLLGVGARMVNDQVTVVVNLSSFENFAVFQKSTSSKVRKILRNARNRLERSHAVSVVSGDEPALVHEAISWAFAERVAWMKRHGRFTPAFAAPVFRTLLESSPGGGLSCLGFCLRAGDRIASAHFGYQYRGRYYAYMSALDPVFEEFSAGRLHLGMVIEDCHGRGLKVLELMPPDSRYKMEWGGIGVPLHAASLAFSFRGSVAFTMTERLLPALRGLSRRIPSFLRRPLVNLLNRH